MENPTDQQLPTIYVTENEINKLYTNFTESSVKNGMDVFNEWFDKGEYPITKGYFIIEKLSDIDLSDRNPNRKDRSAPGVIKFDLSDKKKIHLEIYQVLNGKNDCFASGNVNFNNRKFLKPDILLPSKIDSILEIEYLSLAKMKDAIVPPPPELETDPELADDLHALIMSKSKNTKQIKELATVEFNKYACKTFMVSLGHIITILMYHLAQNRPAYLTPTRKKQYVDGISLKPYKYDGYIDLRESNKVYTVATDTNGELRKFTRHIESWSVRGHQRTYKSGKTVWIGEYVKGQGTLEQRTYATVDRSELDLKTKVFNTQCVEPVSEQKQHQRIEPIPSTEQIETIIPVEKVSKFKQLFNEIKSWF